MKLLIRLSGIVCLFFALVPLLLYGIFNTGVLLFFLASALSFLPAGCWHMLDPRIRRVLWLLFVLGAAAAAFLSFCMVRQAWGRRPERPTHVVVLGSKIIGTQPSLMLRRRLDVAAAYLKENPRALCVVSGGQGEDEVCPEAQVMAAYLSAQGVDENRILEEGASRSTRENLRFSREMLQAALGEQPEEVLIATDAFHQLRASIYAELSGMRAYALPSGTPWGLLPSYWVREWAGISKALLEMLRIRF